MAPKITMKAPTQDKAAPEKVVKPVTANRKLPLARVKKIAKMDEDVQAISNAALMIIAAATEKFAAYFAEQSFFYTLADKKKSLNYKHCSSAVSRLPNLDFLADVVPPTVRIADTEQWQTLAAQKRREDANSKVGDIPEWARAHPEALAKMQAAETEARARSGQDNAPNGNENHVTNGTEQVGSSQTHEAIQDRQNQSNGHHDSIEQEDAEMSDT